MQNSPKNMNSLDQIKGLVTQATDVIVIGFSFFFVHLLFDLSVGSSPTENPKIFATIAVMTLSLTFQIILNFQRDLVLKLNGWIVLLSVFLFSMFISTLNSLDIYISIFGNQEMPTGGLYSYLAALLILIYLWMRSESLSLKRIFQVLAICGVFVAFIGILQRFGIEFIGNWTIETVMKRSSSTIGNPVPYAIFLGSTLLITLTLFFSELSIKKINYLSLIAAVIQFTGLWLSGSRAPIFITILSVGLLTFLILLSNFLPKRAVATPSFQKIFLYLVPFGIIIGISILSLNLIKKDSVSARIQRYPLVESIQDRLSIGAEGVLYSLKEKPLIGYGPGLFSHVYGKAKPVTHNQKYGWSETMLRAHNEVSEIIVSQGLLGFIVYIFIGLAVFIQFYRLVFSNQSMNAFGSESEKPLMIGIFVVVVATFLNSQFMFFYFPNLVLALCLPFFLFNGSATYQLSMPFSKIIGLLRICFIFFLISLFWQNAQMYIGKKELRRAVYEFQNNDLQKALRTIDDAIYLNPYDSAYNCAVVASFGKIGVKNPKEILYPSNKVAIQSAIDGCIESTKLFCGGISLLADNVFYLAKFDKSYIAQAKDIAQSAIDLAPTEVRTYIGYAARLFEVNLFEESKLIAEKGLSLRYEALEFHALLLEIAYAKKDRAEALQVVSRLGQFLKERYPFKTEIPEFRIDDLIFVAKAEAHEEALALLQEIRDDMKRKGATFDRPRTF